MLRNKDHQIFLLSGVQFTQAVLGSNGQGKALRRYEMITPTYFLTRLWIHELVLLGRKI